MIVLKGYIVRAAPPSYDEATDTFGPPTVDIESVRLAGAVNGDIVLASVWHGIYWRYLDGTEPPMINFTTTPAGWTLFTG